MTTKYYKNTITKKLAKKLFVIVSMVVLIGYSIVLSLFLEEEKQNSITFAKETSKMISQDLAELVFLNSVDKATNITTKLRFFKKIKKVIVYKTNKPLYQYENKNLKGDFLVYKSPVSYMGKKIGDITIVVQYEGLDEVLEEYWPIMVFYYILLLFVSIIFIKYFSKTITKPILNLVKFLEGIEFSSSLSKRIKHNYDDEIGKLYDQVNIMLANLEKSIKEINSLKNYDSLTGLMNKNLFIEKIKNLDFNKNYLIICLNIKNFKMLNDVYSHKFGDKILIELANRLKKDFDKVARIGADEFIILTENKNVEEKLSLLNSSRYRHLLINENYIAVKFYIGVLPLSKNIDLLKECDLSISMAKKSKSLIAFYDEKLENEILEEFKILEELKIALKNRELTLFYQLQYKSDESIYGAEALIRWIHPQKGVIPPFKFIPIAEKSDLIVEIGDFVLEEGIKRLSLWQQNKKTKEWVLAVNVSSKQFDDSLIFKLDNLIKKYKINPSKLKIELLESMLFDNTKEVIDRMHKIRNLGVKISLDDFGTGFSSLQYLTTLPINQVKIDQSFVFNMFEDKKNLIIIKSILSLGKDLGMSVIAEGVETKEHFEKLRELGCELFQGYYFAKPEPIEKIEEKIN